MRVKGKNYRTIWLDRKNERVVCVIDQRFLPHRFIIEKISTFEKAVTAIKDMHVRGAGLIGVTAAFGMYLAAIETAGKKNHHELLRIKAKRMTASRPTAVNLAWAVQKQMKAMATAKTPEDRIAIAKQTAISIMEEDAGFSRRIGEHGAAIIEAISRKKKGKTVNILTHCNAGWLAFVDHGTATAPIYEAHQRGVKLHVWVDETRPRNQGASLTAWELLNEGIPHTVIADNTGGHLMQHGMVDLVITGADRVTRTGDAANKIGTYLKALAAKDNNVPFYIALPSSTFDWKLRNGIREIPIEERDPDEVRCIEGLKGRKSVRVLLTPKGSPAAKYRVR